jgi:hypothetical protein
MQRLIASFALISLLLAGRLHAADAPLRAPASEPAAVDGKSFDFIVVGATPGGVACAVRAAREGLDVLLTQHDAHLGGMMTNGLGQWDALYGGHRAPIFTELLGSIDDYYKQKFGPKSRDYQVQHYSQDHYPIGWVEPHVAEREFNRLVANEKRITLLLKHYPAEVEVDGPTIKSVTLRKYGASPGDKGSDIRVSAAAFADATYEGDLFALAGCKYRVGREARDEFDEPHAGKIFTNIAKGPAPTAAVEGKLNIRPYASKQGSIDADSPFTADGAVQAYNMRFSVSRDPANRVLPTEPPPGYDRNEYVNYERKSIAGGVGPNQKSHMNSPILPGENHAYPEADWPTREKITARHRDFGLGLIYFLQNDESVKPADRAKFREWGLSKDEFTDNNHIPYEMYVREARRIVGRHVFTEHDGMLAKDHGRTPIHPDSVAVTDWYMDSHSCTTESRPGYKYEGKLILTEESRPSQIPYRSLLAKEVDNLLVPICLSATHIAWGAIRLEPVWMQTGEAAGFAAALAKKSKTTPAKLDPDLLVRTLVEQKQLVSFFNDMNPSEADACIPAAQYFATKGFFADYDAKPQKLLSQTTAALWAEGFKQLRAGKLDPNDLAKRIAKAGDDDATVSGTQFWQQIAGVLRKAGEPAQLTRGAALQMMWRVLGTKSP